MQQTVINPKIKKQGGYTLVELAIAVAILAVLIVAGLSGVQGILKSSKVNDQIKTVSKMSSKVTSLFASIGTSGITTNNMRDLGAWDSANLVGNVPKSAFSTNEYAVANTADIGNMTAGTGIIYSIYAVPSTLCADLVNGVNSLVYAIGITASAGVAPATGTSVLPAVGQQPKQANASLVPATLATSCALGANVDLIFALKP